MEPSINHIYNEYFPINGSTPNNWDEFWKYDYTQTDFSNPDLKVTTGPTDSTWQTTAQKISLILLKTIIFPWGLYCVTKAALHRLAMMIIYPAQWIPASHISRVRNNLQFLLPLQKKLLREVVLEKDGHQYAGIMVSSQKTVSNGKWALFAPGNGALIEHMALGNPFQQAPTNAYLDAGFNVLLINGPGAGQNKGFATVEKLGDAQELGLTFLETAIKAKKIVLAGHSLGGAAIGLATMKHNFDPNIDYLAIRLMTFGRLTHLVQNLFGNGILAKLASTLLHTLGCEMDSVAASKKLQEENIPEVIFEAEHDEIMKGARLLDTLTSEELLANKSSITLPITHNDLPNANITQEILQWDNLLQQKNAI